MTQIQQNAITLRGRANDNRRSGWCSPDDEAIAEFRNHVKWNARFRALGKICGWTAVFVIGVVAYYWLKA